MAIRHYHHHYHFSYLTSKKRHFSSVLIVNADFDLASFLNSLGDDEGIMKIDNFLMVKQVFHSLFLLQERTTQFRVIDYENRAKKEFKYMLPHLYK